jgi:hypothetical protein
MAGAKVINENVSEGEGIIYCFCGLCSKDIAERPIRIAIDNIAGRINHLPNRTKPVMQIEILKYQRAFLLWLSELFNFRRFIFEIYTLTS